MERIKHGVTANNAAAPRNNLPQIDTQSERLVEERIMSQLKIRRSSDLRSTEISDVRRGGAHRIDHVESSGANMRALPGQEIIFNKIRRKLARTVDGDVNTNKNGKNGLAHFATHKVSSEERKNDEISSTGSDGSATDGDSLQSLGLDL